MKTGQKKNVIDGASNGIKLLGIDYGSKNIGIAISDDGGDMAFPKVILPNDGKALPSILDLIETEGVEEVVIGESTDYTGEENPIMEDIRRFKKNLESRTSVKVNFEPEILSTQEARRLPMHSRVPARRARTQTGGQEDVKIVDSGAATIILQSFIDKRKN